MQSNVADVSIVTYDGDLGPNRIEVSYGTCSVTSDNYERGSIVPKSPWRSAPNSEFSLLARTDIPGPGEIVRVVRFPDKILTSFHELLRKIDYTDRLAVGCVVGAAKGRKIYREFCEYFETLRQLYHQQGEHFGAGGICIKEKDLLSVTTQPGTSTFIGLHVDNYYGYQMGGLRSAPVRICGNLGFDDRFFLFCPVSMDRVWEIVRMEPDVEASFGPTRIARNYLAMHPEIEIVRLRVRPGEAYIAPTENLIHDGSSFGSVAADIACHVLA
jgi:hypothetical protein